MAQTLAILNNAFGPEGWVRSAIERHEVAGGAIYTWRRQAMSGALTGVAVLSQQSFAEAQLAEPEATLPAPVVQAAAQVKAIARGKATLAHVAAAKFDHHLLLYCQTEMMAAQVIELDRSPAGPASHRCCSIRSSAVSGRSA